jgi:peptide/nickel transport system substrate-binding protein
VGARRSQNGAGAGGRVAGTVVAGGMATDTPKGVVPLKPNPTHMVPCSILFATFALAVAPPALASKARKDTLVVLLETGPNNLDIHGVGTNRPAYGTSWNVYDRLLSYGSKSLPDGSVTYDYAKLKPELAESWQVAPDGKSVVFKLRDNARFHDGTPVTAEDVKWSFDRAVTVGGFPTFQMKAGSLESPEQFEVVDKHTFRIKLLRNDKMTLPDLAVPVPVIINAKLAKKNATAKDPWAMEWLKNNTAAGGAYKVEAWRPGQEMILVRNEEWKSGPLPRIRRVILREVPSASAQLALLKRGDADIAFGLAPKDTQTMRKAGLKVLSHPVENAMWYVGMSVTQPPFDDVRVRQAVAYAVPYDKILTSVLYGRGIKLYGGKNGKPADETWPQPTGYKTDLAKAKALLKEAGREGGFETTLSFDQGFSAIGEPLAVLLQESLGQIGIKVTINKIPGSSWRAALLKKDLPLVINNMGGWLNYPEYFFFWAYHGQNAVFNTMSYKNGALDRLVDEARFEKDPKKYVTQVRDFINIAYTEVPRVPLFQPLLDVAMQKGVSGYQYWFHRQLDLRQLKKD